MVFKNKFFFLYTTNYKTMYIIKEICNIIKISFRNPTPKITKLIPLKWKPVKTNSSLEYLYIGNSTNVIMEKNLLWERMMFWNKLTHQMKFHGADFKNFKDEL